MKIGKKKLLVFHLSRHFDLKPKRWSIQISVKIYNEDLFGYASVLFSLLFFPNVSFLRALMHSFFSSFTYYRFTEIWWTATKYHSPRWKRLCVIVRRGSTSNVQGNWNAIFLLIFFWLWIWMRVIPESRWKKNWFVSCAWRGLFFGHVMIMILGNHLSYSENEDMKQAI